LKLQLEGYFGDESFAFPLSITELALDNVPINVLHFLPPLKVLSLSFTAFEDERSSISFPTSLHTLILHNSNLTPECFSQRPSSLKHLHCTSCEFVLDSTSNWEPIDISLPSSIEVLEFVRAPIGQESYDMFPKSVKHLSLQACHVRDDDISHLPPNLERLILGENIGFTGTGLERFSQLQSLSLFRTATDDEALKTLPSQLTYLNLIFCNVTTLKYLPPRLKYFECADVEDIELQHIPSTVTHLVLYGKKFTNQGMKYLSTNLQYLDISPTNLDSECVPFLPSTLQTLRVRENVQKKFQEAIQQCGYSIEIGDGFSMHFFVFAGLDSEEL